MLGLRIDVVERAHRFTKAWPLPAFAPGGRAREYRWLNKSSEQRPRNRSEIRPVGQCRGRRLRLPGAANRNDGLPRRLDPKEIRMNSRSLPGGRRIPWA